MKKFEVVYNVTEYHTYKYEVEAESREMVDSMIENGVLLDFAKQKDDILENYEEQIVSIKEEKNGLTTN